MITRLLRQENWSKGCCEVKRLRAGVCVLAELVSGRTRLRAGYGRQRWCCGLCLGSWLLCRQMALRARRAGLLRVALPQLSGGVPGPR
jgi:hypothetical protein